MSTRDPAFSVVAYAKRARSALYRTPKDQHPLSTLDAFREASRLFPKIGVAWIAKLNSIAQQDMFAILENVPRGVMSPVARDFAMHLLAENTQRLVQVAEAG